MCVLTDSMGQTSAQVTARWLGWTTAQVTARWLSEERSRSDLLLPMNLGLLKRGGDMRKERKKII